MEEKNLAGIVLNIIKSVESLIPTYMNIEEDRINADGNVAICIIDNEGCIYGKTFGNDKIRRREAYRIAWIKASQVWITGLKTGEYEKLAFNGEIDEKQFGIKRPEYIGWQGGQPITLKDGTKLFAGFSGFRGSTDIEIVIQATIKSGLNIEHNPMA